MYCSGQIEKKCSLATVDHSCMTENSVSVTKSCTLAVSRSVPPFIFNQIDFVFARKNKLRICRFGKTTRQTDHQKSNFLDLHLDNVQQEALQAHGDNQIIYKVTIKHTFTTPINYLLSFFRAFTAQTIFKSTVVRKMQKNWLVQEVKIFTGSH